MSNPFQDNVVDITGRLLLAPEIRAMIAVLKVGARIADDMEASFPALTQYEQRVMATILAFRLMGSMMPASVELFAHLPLTGKMTETNVMNACETLVDQGTLENPVQGQDMCFVWPDLEKLIAIAMADADAPRIVGADGERIR